MVEILSSARILRGAPWLDFGIFPVFQPPIVVGDFDSAILVGNRTLGRRWGLGNDWSRSEGDNRHQADGGRTRDGGGVFIEIPRQPTQERPRRRHRAFSFLT